MLSTIRRAFRPLDTSDVDTAIASARAAHRDVQVRARALRRDVSCGDPIAAIRQLAEPVLAALAPQTPFDVFKADPNTPADMAALLRKI